MSEVEDLMKQANEQIAMSTKQLVMVMVANKVLDKRRLVLMLRMLIHAHESVTLWLYSQLAEAELK